MPLFRVQFRRDTTENWENYNPILLEGEVGYEVTKTPGLILMKQGDGYIAADGKIYGTPWNDLPYCSGPMGPSPDYQWDGTILMFKKPDGTWGPGQDLVGPVPAHRWIGTALQFQTQTGAWGNLVDLQGTPGNANLLPATPTKIGGIIIGPGLDVNEQGCASVDKDFIYGLGGNLCLNDEIWITQSGTFTAPVDGWYEVLLIGGGNGGIVTDYGLFGGQGGSIYQRLVHLTAGTEVQVIIGTGGIGDLQGRYLPSLGGSTTFFGELSSGDGAAMLASLGISVGMSTHFPASFAPRGNYLGGWGGGPGGGAPSSLQSLCHGQFFGAGGSAAQMANASQLLVGNGMQGAVRLRFWNPAKAAGPEATPALLSARRMAVRAVSAPVTVNLYDPETGQGSVWKEEDAEQAMEQRGLISEEAWLAQVKEKQAAEYDAWLADPTKDEERIEMLRAACEAKLAETDKLTLPDFPITEEQRQAVLAYRQAIRALNRQPGAPWDGGGEQTPWPEEPPFLAAILNREQPTDE